MGGDFNRLGRHGAPRVSRARRVRKEISKTGRTPDTVAALLDRGWCELKGMLVWWEPFDFAVLGLNQNKGEHFYFCGLLAMLSIQCDAIVWGLCQLRVPRAPRLKLKWNHCLKLNPFPHPKITSQHLGFYHVCRFGLLHWRALYLGRGEWH